MHQASDRFVSLSRCLFVGGWVCLPCASAGDRADSEPRLRMLSEALEESLVLGSDLLQLALQPRALALVYRQEIPAAKEKKE